tara:strand:- start:9138 stop:9761 length:624 start_codon:yes stop_codon:yes gene_type:complete
MLKIGFDFDNTLVNYDETFYKLALERGIIPKNLIKDKISVRNYLREQGKDKLFTSLQGEVYGKKLFDIKPSSGLIRILKILKNKGHNLLIVSHKTKTPFLGPKYDLHQAAAKWLEKNGFFNQQGLNLPFDKVFFEETFQKKLSRISDLSCDVFIDDLPEVLCELNKKITGIHFCNNFKQTSKNQFITLSEWNNLPDIIDEIIRKKNI